VDLGSTNNELKQANNTRDGGAVPIALLSEQLESVQLGISRDLQQEFSLRLQQWQP
jgi:hypothetical protein